MNRPGKQCATFEIQEMDQSAKVETLVVVRRELPSSRVPRGELGLIQIPGILRPQPADALIIHQIAFQRQSVPVGKIVEWNEGIRGVPDLETVGKIAVGEGDLTHSHIQTQELQVLDRLQLLCKIQRSAWVWRGEKRGRFGLDHQSFRADLVSIFRSKNRF